MSVSHNGSHDDRAASIESLRESHQDRTGPGAQSRRREEARAELDEQVDKALDVPMSQEEARAAREVERLEEEARIDAIRERKRAGRTDGDVAALIEERRNRDQDRSARTAAAHDSEVERLNAVGRQARAAYLARQSTYRTETVARAQERAEVKRKALRERQAFISSGGRVTSIED